ncbi:hypothetical protein PENARI_c039G03469 [Penicillium arizonense]|uniref:HTH CENPB-type domain-containing protein n=1 Tax=Penicillium arizonense TaxID=1835702 RepID=A0A1F5L412_PENAI|nr:hypothetical protein PENARI_c039G03469 [Penicillium arizonense]OGE47651.1 hypothetical protein PENARI_c039G03469 [Penicillium arizonense]
MELPNLDPWTPTETDDMYSLQVPPPYGSMPHSMNYLAPPQLQAPIPISSSAVYESFASPSRAPISTLPSSLARASHSRKGPAAKSTPPRPLTDEYRRMICLYHERNKAAKQTEIGALFGVERSTVSKIVKRKERYLLINNRGQSPENRTKGRVPDLKTALSNLVKQYQKSKIPINDEILMDKALAFAHACSLTEGSGALDKDWLEKFKRENNMSFAHNRPCTKDGQARHTQPQGITSNIITRNMNDISPISVREPPSTGQARGAMELVIDYFDKIGKVSPQERVSIGRVMERLENDHRMFRVKNNWCVQPSGEVPLGLDATLPTNLF